MHQKPQICPLEPANCGVKQISPHQAARMTGSSGPNGGGVIHVASCTWGAKLTWHHPMLTTGSATCVLTYSSTREDSKAQIRAASCARLASVLQLTLALLGSWILHENQQNHYCQWSAPSHHVELSLKSSGIRNQMTFLVERLKALTAKNHVLQRHKHPGLCSRLGSSRYTCNCIHSMNSTARLSTAEVHPLPSPQCIAPTRGSSVLCGHSCSSSQHHHLPLAFRQATLLRWCRVEASGVSFHSFLRLAHGFWLPAPQFLVHSSQSYGGTFLLPHEPHVRMRPQYELCHVPHGLHGVGSWPVARACAFTCTCSFVIVLGRTVGGTRKAWTGREPLGSCAFGGVCMPRAF